MSVRIFTQPDELDEFFHAVEAVAGEDLPARARGGVRRDAGAPRADAGEHGEGWFRGYVL